MARKTHHMHLYIFALLIGAVFVFVIVTLSSVFAGERNLFASTAAILPPALVRLANDDRSLEGETALTISPILQKAAEAKARDMAEKGYFSHQSPDGKTPWEWIHESGYQFTAAGENLGVNFTDSSKLHRAWMLSPLHRKNLLNAHFSEIGIGTADGIYKGKPATFVVEYFANPVK